MLLESLLALVVCWTCFIPTVCPVNPGKSKDFCFIAKFVESCISCSIVAVTVEINANIFRRACARSV